MVDFDEIEETLNAGISPEELDENIRQHERELDGRRVIVEDADQDAGPAIVDGDFVLIEIEREIPAQLRLIMDHVTPDIGFVCGGFVRWLCDATESAAKPGDIDIYPRTEWAAEVMVNRVTKLGYEKNEKRSTVAATTWDHPDHEFPVQVIEPHNEGHMMTFGDLPSVLNNFDFTIARAGIFPFYFDVETGGRSVALVDWQFKSDVADRRLRVRNIHCPVSSVYRAAKYMKRGFWFPTSECIKLFLDWDQRSDDYKRDIERLVDSKKADKDLDEKEWEHIERLMRID